jgi:hypothetical protein
VGFRLVFAPAGSALYMLLGACTLVRTTTQPAARHWDSAMADHGAQHVATDPDALTLDYNWRVIVPTSDGPSLTREGGSS